MGDGQESLICEFLAQHLLDKVIMRDVDIGCGFVNQDYFGVFEESPADTYKLLFTSR